MVWVNLKRQYNNPDAGPSESPAPQGCTWGTLLTTFTQRTIFCIFFFKAAIDTGKLDPKGARFPDGAGVIIAIHGTSKRIGKLSRPDKSQHPQLVDTANRKKERGLSIIGGLDSKKYNLCVYGYWKLQKYEGQFSKTGKEPSGLL